MQNDEELLRQQELQEQQRQQQEQARQQQSAGDQFTDQSMQSVRDPVIINK